MLSRDSSLLVLLMLPVTCASPAVKEPVATSTTTKDAAPHGPIDVHAELKGLMRRTADLKACTATYRTTGPSDGTIRITYAAPDRVCLEFDQTRSGLRSDDRVWMIKNREIARSKHGDELQCADIDLKLEDLDAVLAAAENAFPSPPDGEAEKDFGAGVCISFWLTPDANDVEEGNLDVTVSCMTHRDSIFEWLQRAGSLPVLRDDGEHIVGEDPKARLVVAISKSTGFIDRIIGASGTVDLVSWVPSADEAAFTIPPPVPGAKDISEDYRHVQFGLFAGAMEASIEGTALEARRRDSLSDEEFTRRLASVYDVLNRKLRLYDLTSLRDHLKKGLDDTIDLYRRQLSAAATDSDFRGIADQWIATQRLSIANAVAMAAEHASGPAPQSIADAVGDAIPEAPSLQDSDPHAADLIAQVRHRSIASFFDAEVTQPALKYFDAQVDAVRSKK